MTASSWCNSMPDCPARSCLQAPPSNMSQCSTKSCLHSFWCGSAVNFKGAVPHKSSSAPAPTASCSPLCGSGGGSIGSRRALCTALKRSRTAVVTAAACLRQESLRSRCEHSRQAGAAPHRFWGPTQCRDLACAAVWQHGVHSSDEHCEHEVRPASPALRDTSRWLEAVHQVASNCFRLARRPLLQDGAPLSCRRRRALAPRRTAGPAARSRRFTFHAGPAAKHQGLFCKPERKQAARTACLGSDGRSGSTVELVTFCVTSREA